MADAEFRVRGFRDLERELASMPRRMAGRLQGAFVSNHLDHRRAIARRSKFSPDGRRRVARSIRVLPDKKSKARAPRSIAAVSAATVSYWRGPDTPSNARGAGTAARLEKEIGERTTRPTRGRYLLIPTGDFVTEGGRPRRTGRGRASKPVDIADLPDVRIVRTRTSLILVQSLGGGKRGFREAQGAKARGQTLGKGRELGDRERVVGILVPRVRTVRGLDFFGSWDSLERKRDDRYIRLLDAVASNRRGK